MLCEECHRRKAKAIIKGKDVCQSCFDDIKKPQVTNGRWIDGLVKKYGNKK